MTEVTQVAIIWHAYSLNCYLSFETYSGDYSYFCGNVENFRGAFLINALQIKKLCLQCWTGVRSYF